LCALLFVEKELVRFCEAVEGVGGGGVGCFVGMDEQGFLAVHFYDVGGGETGLDVEDGVGVEAEGFEDAVYFGVLWEGGRWLVVVMLRVGAG